MIEKDKMIESFKVQGTLRKVLSFRRRMKKPHASLMVGIKKDRITFYPI